MFCCVFMMQRIMTIIGEVDSGSPQLVNTLSKTSPFQQKLKAQPILERGKPRLALIMDA